MAIVLGLRHAALPGNDGPCRRGVHLPSEDRGLFGEAGIAAHQKIIADDVDFAALAKARGHLHQLIETADRHLEGQHAEQRAVRIDQRGGNEAGRGVLARRIGVEIEECLVAGVGTVAGGAKDLPQGRVGPLAGDQVGAVVEFLEHGVDDVAGRIGQEDVVVSPLAQEPPQPRMVAGMGLAVGRTVARRVEVFPASDRVRVFVDVMALQGFHRIAVHHPPPDGKGGQRLVDQRVRALDAEIRLDGPQIVRQSRVPCFEHRRQLRLGFLTKRPAASQIGDRSRCQRCDQGGGDDRHRYFFRQAKTCETLFANTRS